MRNIITLSLPEKLGSAVDHEVKKRHFASRSEFFRYLLREWSAGRLAQEFEEGRKEYRTGKSKKLRSMKNFW